MSGLLDLPSLLATLSAKMELLPCAMLAKGPACTNTGVPSNVCISVGLIVSFISTARAPGGSEKKWVYPYSEISNSSKPYTHRPRQCRPR